MWSHSFLLKRIAYADTIKAKPLLGSHSKVSGAEGAAKLITWLKKHEKSNKKRPAPKS